MIELEPFLGLVLEGMLLVMGYLGEEIDEGEERRKIYLPER